MAIRWQAAQRQVLWGLLEWGTGGLGPFKIDAIIQAVDADAETWKYLKYFCQAVEEGQITTCPVKLIGVNALDAAVKQGKWIYRLTSPRRDDQAGHAPQRVRGTDRRRVGGGEVRGVLRGLQARAPDPDREGVQLL